jgi:hypothetical protein
MIFCKKLRNMIISIKNKEMKYDKYIQRRYLKIFLDKECMKGNLYISVFDKHNNF